MSAIRCKSSLQDPAVAIVVVWLLLAFTGCTTKHSASAKERVAAKASTSSSDPSEHYFDGGTYCVQKFTQGPSPAQPLHFSNKVTESDGSAKDFEEDLSGDALDQTIAEQHPATDEDRQLASASGAASVWSIQGGLAEMRTTNHYMRSDASGWNVGSNGAVLSAAPWGLFILKPHVGRLGTEQVNGYNTIKYVVDTTHESGMDKAPGLLRQLKDYNITGTAWVLQDANCVLQYDIEDERVGMDGKVSKTHYEGTITKK